MQLGRLFNRELVNIGVSNASYSAADIAPALLGVVSF